MRIKTTYGQLKVGDRFFYDFTNPECACRLKTDSGEITHFADGAVMYSPETWQYADEVWIDTEEAAGFEDYLTDIEEKLKQQAAETANLKECIQDARSLMEDYDGYETAKGLRELIDQVDTLLMTHKPMEWLSPEKAGEQ